MPRFAAGILKVSVYLVSFVASDSQCFSPKSTVAERMIKVSSSIMLRGEEDPRKDKHKEETRKKQMGPRIGGGKNRYQKESVPEWSSQSGLE